MAADIGGAVVPVEAELEPADRTLLKQDRSRDRRQYGRPSRCEEVVTSMESSSGARKAPVIEILRSRHRTAPGTDGSLHLDLLADPDEVRIGYAVGRNQRVDGRPIAGSHHGQALSGGYDVHGDARGRRRPGDEGAAGQLEDGSDVDHRCVGDPIGGGDRFDGRPVSGRDGCEGLAGPDGVGSACCRCAYGRCACCRCARGRCRSRGYHYLLADPDQVRIGEVVRRHQGVDAGAVPAGDPCQGLPGRDHMGGGWRCGRLTGHHEHLADPDEIGIGNSVRRDQLGLRHPQLGRDLIEGVSGLDLVVGAGSSDEYHQGDRGGYGSKPPGPGWAGGLLVGVWLHANLFPAPVRPKVSPTLHRTAPGSKSR